MTYWRLFLFALLATFSTARAQEATQPGVTGGESLNKPSMAKHPPPACSDPKPDCAMTIYPAFDKKGLLWVAYSVGKTLYVASSQDQGKTFSSPTTIITLSDGIIDAHGDARPKIIPLNDNSLLVSYTTRPDKMMIGTIFTAKSSDNGKNFSTPQPMLTSGGQRFDSYVVTSKGRIFAGWLDKTHAAQAKAEGKEFAGSGVAFAWSDDGGMTFKGKNILMDHACECCRISAALGRDGLPVFAWRQIFEGEIRDHYAAKLSANGAKLIGGRVSNDDWAINSCPHQGPALAVDTKGVWHIAWFTKGKNRQGLFYAFSRDEGKTFSTPEKIGDDAHAPAFATLLATKKGLYRAWKEFDGAQTTIPIQQSRDGGKSWSAPQILASTTEASDHPILVALKGDVFLSWGTHKEGYRLIPLNLAKK
ncbi:MAG: exo-alpha-sialidase [Methylocystaceae bacterium]|nr:exo-alpha-sialidase [Methylocystaceae bacterium]